MSRNENRCDKHRILIVGVGALGGTIAARSLNAGLSVFLAVRKDEMAKSLRFSGLRISGAGGPVAVPAFNVATIEQYRGMEKFNFILLATKAHEALELAPQLLDLLQPAGAIVSLQNGCVPLMLADRLGSENVLGGISSLAATLAEPGRFEQRNTGNVVLGETKEGGISERVARLEELLGKGVEVRVTPNLRGIIWSKLLINCSATTIGAITGKSMREYLRSSLGKEVFLRAYREVLAVALACGVRPEKMIVEPAPPNWPDEEAPGPALDRWLDELLKAYGDGKASMLQNLERGRRTEIDFINGYVSRLAGEVGVLTPMNSAIADLVHQLEQKLTRPNLQQLDRLMARASHGNKRAVAR
jgi:2-dehydropantoate 2-reductase